MRTSPLKRRLSPSEGIPAVLRRKTRKKQPLFCRFFQHFRCFFRCFFRFFHFFFKFFFRIFRVFCDFRFFFTCFSPCFSSHFSSQFRRKSWKKARFDCNSREIPRICLERLHKPPAWSLGFSRQRLEVYCSHLRRISTSNSRQIRVAQPLLRRNPRRTYIRRSPCF